MQVTIFENEGTIDLNTIMTFGVSVKESDNPIGQFGTGLKYALAILLREDHQVYMYCGSQEYRFWKSPMDIRGQSFDMVMMNDIKLPFTTELGKHWELWMAFRELYSNTKDESGDCWVSEEENPWGTDEGSTRFVVIGDEFAGIALDKGAVFIEDEEPLVETDTFELIDSEPTHSVYARGIRVAEFERPLMSTYNLKGKVDLTEDRTLKSPEWTLDQRIMNAAAQSTNEAFIERVLTAPQEYHESGLDFRWITLGETFLLVARRLLSERKTINSSVAKLIKDADEEERKRKHIRRRYIRIAVDVPESVSDDDLISAVRSTLRHELGGEDIEIDEDIQPAPTISDSF